MLGGAVVSLVLTVVIFILSLFFGTLVGLARYRRDKRVTYCVATVYVEIIRNTPLLVQIFFLYFGLPQFGIYLPVIFAGVLAMTINNCAYIAETVRAGIQSISKGQWEAADCLGLSRLWVFWDVIFPQTLRNIFPALTNQCIMILFGTSLLSVLDIKDLMQRASILNSQSFRTVEIYVFAVALYYVLALICSTVMRFINRRYFPSVSQRG